jgi:hypothetical protein
MIRVLFVLGLVACKQEPSQTVGPATAIQPRASIPAAKADGVSGTIVETMNAGGYTYARLDHDGSQLWVAGPETKLAVGTKLDRMDGTAMSNFHSDTLARTFEQIYFVNAFAIAGGAPASAVAADDDISGVVLETMNAGGYTYAHLDRSGTKLWVAGPQTKLAVGAKLDKLSGSLMSNFQSDSLKRTFDRIYFVDSFGAHASTATPQPAEPDPKIAAAPGGKTIADVIASKDALAGKAVVVRGRVVKLNNGIMDRNWIHLRDGSGTSGADDLLVTTQQTAQLGDIVVARGTVATHQDFGAGYKYDVVVENATLASQ